MNERIEKLGEQADLLGEFTPTKIPGRYVGYITEEQILKFAELIVQECLSKVDKTGFAFNEQPQYNNKQNALVSEGFFWALESVKQQIKQHFGVEE